MKEDLIKSIVIAAVSKKAGIDAKEVAMDSKLADDIGLDSLDRLETSMEIERECDVVFTDQEEEGVVAVGDYVELVKTKQR
ncbi:MAG: hypothetical protein IJM04_04170 [Prevotella sp.]|nr:hypothetical protein [Prevotella sp.]